ncbi:MAG: hypothetical protein RMM51_00690 [Verrucomicrobiae bacterium]|nr:hypothetical protein [Verrucomicrobiae bacterium]
MHDPTLPQRNPLAGTRPARHIDAVDQSPTLPACERCGAPRASRIADRWLCTDCYTAAGSCCPEFGADDLWQHHPDTSPRIRPNPPDTGPPRPGTPPASRPAA